MRVYARASLPATRALQGVASSDSSEVLLSEAQLLSMLGRHREAIREAERGAALSRPSQNGIYGPYRQEQLALIYLWSGEHERALDVLEPLLKVPHWLSSAWLRIDPNFAALRGNPRFERIIAEPTSTRTPTA